MNFDKKEKISKMLNDAVELTKCSSRYLTKTPLFEGGKVSYGNHFTIEERKLKDEYNYVISLSDELTNDLVRKFASYILRSGVSESEVEEARLYLTEILKDEK
mgnify:FL=1